MPVITSACGIGSPPEPGRRAAARDHAEQEEHAAAEEIEGEQLPQRLGLHDKAIEAQADQRGAAEPEQRDLAHRRRPFGGPATSRPSVAAIESHQRDLDHDDQRLGPGFRVGEE